MKTRGNEKNNSACKAKILLAEDNPVNRELTRHMLENIGCDVELAGDGREAIEAFSRNNFDLVFMDCQMPRLDGYHASMMMRDMEKAVDIKSRVPIIAITAHADKNERSKCLASGMDDCLNKPFKEHQLVVVLKKWLPELFAQSKGSRCAESGLGGPCLGPENEPVLDRQTLNAIRDLQSPGEEDLLVKLVGLFVDLLPAQLLALRLAIGDNNASRVEEVAHKLKSSSGNLGATKMSDLCSQLVDLAESGNLELAPPVYEKIMSEAEKVRTALSAEVRDVNSQK